MVKEPISDEKMREARIKGRAARILFKTEYTLKDAVSFRLFLHNLKKDAGEDFPHYVNVILLNEKLRIAYEKLESMFPIESITNEVIRKVLNPKTSKK